MKRLPSQIVAEPRAGGVCYHLGTRDIGLLRKFGGGAIFVGLVIVGAALIWTVLTLRDHWPDDLGDWLGYLPTLMALMIGQSAISAGMLIGFSKSRVLLRGGRIYAIEGVGIMRWKRKRPIDRIQKIEVISGGEDAHLDSNAAPGMATLAKLAAIRLSGENMNSMLVSIAFPAEVLLPLAEQLADDIESETRQRPEVVSTTKKLTGVIEREALAAPADEPAGQQPPGSQMILEQRPDGLTIIVPPLGMRGVTRTMLILGAVITLIGIPFIIVIIGLLFVIIGLMMVVGAIRNARRRAIIDVVGDVLLISMAGPFGSSQREWRAVDLNRIQAAPSGTSVNNVPLFELQIRPRSGGKVGYFGGRDKDELRWLAATLRDALNLTATDEPEA
ncbi:hypothetical protein HED60_22845 [Planctomycetales bacterium ZRK34]|nr:hypothetical protein HED60_22845 [Planctomycetales bacterium ZRK34]